MAPNFIQEDPETSERHEAEAYDWNASIQQHGVVDYQTRRREDRW